MAAFSTRLWLSLCGALLASGCDAPQAAGTETAPREAVAPSRAPVDPGEDGQSRTLLQHYRARDLAGGKLSVPAGERLGAEATAWQLPFQSKRIVASFLTSLSRGAVDELQYTLAPGATFGRPDPRRPHERPIFEGDNLLEFFDGAHAAASRMDEMTTYKNPTSFVMGLQERIRSGAEPVWAFYESGPDKLMFRFRMYGSRAYIDYVGYFPEAPTEPVDYSALGPAPPMMPGIWTDENRILRDFDPAKVNARRQQAGRGGRGTPPPTPQ
ncbi:MAG: hypothetical protein ACRBN8_15885 [Nannocystales bacterium]